MKQAIAFGKAVRRQRVRRGWSQDKLAERAGLVGKYVGSIERGERDPGLFVMDVLAQSLGTPLGELLGSKLALSAQAVEMARDFVGCDESIQEAVLQILKAVKPPAELRRLRNRI